MDPKMDSGFLAGGETIEDEFDVLRELLPEEIVGLMDQILCHEVAWHMGHPLSQSLFTSYHIDRLLLPTPKSLEEANFDRDQRSRSGNEILHTAFRAFCLALIKYCDFIYRRIGKEHYYEEEDFVSNLYNRNLLTDVAAEEIHELLGQAIYLTEQETSIDEAVRSAITNRLRLRERLLIAVECDLNPDKDAQIQYWKHCAELLPDLLKTRRIAKPVQEAFSIKIQRRLASSVPPRPMVEVDFNDAHVFLCHLCRDAADVYYILECSGNSNILNFTYVFQSRKPQPSVYIRCLLQSLIFHDMKVLGKITITKLIFDDLEELVLPADILIDPANGNVEAPHDPRFQIAEEMRRLVLRIGDPFLDMFRAIFLDWESVQLEAENLDVEVRKYTGEKPLVDGEPASTEVWSFPLSSWVYYYKLRQVEWIVQLGFELDIYQDDELSSMYWYLSHVAAARIQHLERIQTFVTRRFRQWRGWAPNQKKSFKRCHSFLDVALLEASATQWFAISLSKLYTVLSHFSIVKNRPLPLPYSTPELRYALRMRPFLQLSIPELPSYAEFSAASSFEPGEAQNDGGFSAGVQVLSTLNAAEEAIRVARKEWEALSKLDAETARVTNAEEWWRASIKDVIRACIVCSIAIATAKRGFQNAKGKQLSEVLKAEMPKGKSYHDFWIVPRLSVQQ
ncbi:MAG: hypothetical protein Q9201_005601 [Fulgogasparrea decipioides]